MNHRLVRLAELIDWEKFNLLFGELFPSHRGRPALPTRLMVGLQYLKYLENISDEELIERFVENPYCPYFCGFEYFQKEFPCDSTSLTRWRKRFGEEGAEKLLQETLATAHKAGLLRGADVTSVYVDTTIQEKNITYPTDAKLLGRLHQK